MATATEDESSQPLTGSKRQNPDQQQPPTKRPKLSKSENANTDTNTATFDIDTKEVDNDIKDSQTKEALQLLDNALEGETVQQQNAQSNQQQVHATDEHDQTNPTDTELEDNDIDPDDFLNDDIDQNKTETDAESDSDVGENGDTIETPSITTIKELLTIDTDEYLENGIVNYEKLIQETQNKMVQVNHEYDKLKANIAQVTGEYNDLVADRDNLYDTYELLREELQKYKQENKNTENLLEIINGEKQALTENYEKELSTLKQEYQIQVALVEKYGKQLNIFTRKVPILHEKLIKTQNELIQTKTKCLNYEQQIKQTSS